jgi:hypothetical protein
MAALPAAESFGQKGAVLRDAGYDGHERIKL